MPHNDQLQGLTSFLAVAQLSSPAAWELK